VKELTVWILQTGEPLPIDLENPRPMRAVNLANALIAAGHRVVLWSSAFSHQKKQHRSHKASKIIISDRLEIRLIPSPGYQRNIGLARLWDHLQLAINLKKLIKEEATQPDVAFIGYPPIETAVVFGKWLEQRGIPFLLDVKDLWPSVFLEEVPKPLRPIGRMILWPYFRLAKGCVKRATGVSAMSDSFLYRVLAISKRKMLNADGVFPLTSASERLSSTELATAQNWWDDLGVRNDGTKRVCYVGNHSPNVDLAPVREAANIFIKQKAPVEFIIAGDGVSFLKFKTMMSGLANVRFPGLIDRPKIIALAERAHAALIPYVNSENFLLSLPNKTFDALSLGLPILSPLQGEVASLIAKHGVGISYGTDTGNTLYDCIQVLLQDIALQESMSQKARTLYAERFSFEMVYGGLVKHLELLANSRVVSDHH
jgi:glycosyltransferase involved in cell wall biosynthesis